MNLKLIQIVSLLVAMFSINYSYSQDDTTKTQPKLYKVVKHDGIEYIGEILSDDGREVLLLTEDLGKIYIPKADIKSMKLIEHPEEIVRGNYREVGPFTTRYYFTNNALPIKKGEDYAMVHLYGPEVHFSVKDNLSIGIMATWIASPIGIALKYSIPTKNEKINLSLGTIMFSSGYLFQAKGYGGLHWGSLTYGQAGKNINFSAGFGYVDLGFDRQHDSESGWQRVKNGPVLSIAGLTPVGERASFIFDSMIILSEQRNYYGSYLGNGEYISLYRSGTKVTSLLMPGMRFQKTDRRAFQVALAGVIEWSSIGFNSNSTSSATRTIPVPMCSWFFKF